MAILPETTLRKVADSLRSCICRKFSVSFHMFLFRIFRANLALTEVAQKLATALASIRVAEGAIRESATALKSIEPDNQDVPGMSRTLC